MPPEIFHGRDVSSLLAEARARLGADAVVLSLRRRRDGADFELTAAAAMRRDATATTAASATATRPEPRTGPGAGELGPIIGYPGGPPPTPRPIPEAHDAPDEGAVEPASSGPAVVALVGPTGAGKTTTIAKLAQHPCVFGETSVGLLCLDTFRVGAVDQIRLYAELSRMPLEVAYDVRDVAAALRRLSRCAVVLVDTAGRGPGGRADSAATRAMLRAARPLEVHLALPAGLQARYARRLIEHHRAFGVTHVLPTKCDEFPEDRVPFDAATEAGLTVCWIANGQRVPGDLSPATAAWAPARADVLEVA